MARFVVNGRFLAKPVGGVARVGRELLRAMIAEAREQGGPAFTIAAPPGVSIPTMAGDVAADGAWPDGPVTIAPGFSSNLGEQTRLPLAFPNATLLSFCNATPMLGPRSVIWLHDTHVFDAPESYTLPFRLWHRAMLAAVIARGFPVVTVSEFSRGRLIAHGVKPEKVAAVHNGGDHILHAPADESALKAAGLAGAPFVLVLGSPAKLKNVPFAIRALASGLDPAIKIAVVGLSQQGPYAASAAAGGDPRVITLPMISDGELRALYQHAGAVIVPSLLEGFGLYAAEAMFEGGPLVLSDRGALPEVGGEAALYFDATDEAALVRAVKQSLEPETAARLVAAARARAPHYRWRRAARQVIDLHLSQT